MPITAFVYQFFLYNSLYQIDWDASLQDKVLVYNEKNSAETAQQKKLEIFMLCHDKQAIRLRSNFHILDEFSFNGDWTSVIPDTRVTTEDGREFFQRIQELQAAARDLQKPIKAGSLYNKVDDCRRFIYNVRCNIFHGSKTLGETYEPAQSKRIDVYYQFLYALVLSFFDIVDEEKRKQSHTEL